MLQAYKDRRRAKHEAQKEAKTASATFPVTESPLIHFLDRTVKLPRLSWLSGKTRPSSSGGRANRPGHGPEHVQALYENEHKSDNVPVQEPV